MAQIEAAGIALDVTERGAGRSLLVIHGLGCDAAAWVPRLADLGGRAIAYDRRGYGASGAPEPYVATTIQEQGEDAAAVLAALDAAPALLVGDGFGALVALDLLVRHRDLASAAVLIDPPLHAHVAAATEVLSAQREQLERALRDGGPAAAIAALLPAGAAPARLARAQASARGVLADYAGQSSWSPSRRELRALGVPIAVATDRATPAHVVAAADAIAALLPDCRRHAGGDLAAAVDELDRRGRVSAPRSER